MKRWRRRKGPRCAIFAHIVVISIFPSLSGLFTSLVALYPFNALSSFDWEFISVRFPSWSIVAGVFANVCLCVKLSSDE
jgi:hypothetical protein